MKTLFYAVAFLALFSQNAVAKNDAPDWINDPYKVCSKNDMCAVGVGSGLKMARADARNGIAKIFETRLKSSFSAETGSDNDDVFSKMRDFLNVETDMLIEAVEIKETYQTPTEVYALAVLNKNTATRLTNEDLERLDDKMRALLRDDTPASAVALKKTYDQRTALNRRYLILTGAPKPEAVGYDAVFTAQKTRIGRRHIYLVVKGSDAFSSAVRSVLTQNGYTFADKPDASVPQVTVSLTESEQYLNIPGFLKFKYDFKLKAPDRNGVVVTMLSAEFDETGRVPQQAEAEALTELKQYLNENILSLKF